MDKFELRLEPLILRSEINRARFKDRFGTVLKLLSDASANTYAMWVQWGELRVPIRTDQLRLMDEFLSWISEIQEQPSGMMHANCADQGGNFTWLASWQGDELLLEEMNGDKPVLKLSRHDFLTAWKGGLAQWLDDFERIKETVGLEGGPAVEDAQWMRELYQRLSEMQ